MKMLTLWACVESTAGPQQILAVGYVPGLETGVAGTRLNSQTGHRRNFGKMPPRQSVT